MLFSANKHYSSHRQAHEALVLNSSAQLLVEPVPCPNGQTFAVSLGGHEILVKRNPLQARGINAMGLVKSCCADCRVVITKAKALGIAMVPFGEFNSLVSRGHLPLRGRDLVHYCESLVVVEMEQVHDRLILPVAGQYDITKKMGAERTTQNKKHSSTQQSATSRTLRTPTTTLVAAAGLQQVNVVTLSHNHPKSRQLAPEAWYRAYGKQLLLRPDLLPEAHPPRHKKSSIKPGTILLSWERFIEAASASILKTLNNYSCAISTTDGEGYHQSAPATESPFRAARDTYTGSMGLIWQRLMGGFAQFALFSFLTGACAEVILSNATYIVVRLTGPRTDNM
jgi:hypothetical protein